MTFSLLVRDPETGLLGGAAATGSLCVGGWVLRGRTGIGLSASQGASPSTLWGEAVLDAIAGGEAADAAVSRITEADAGRDWRQLSALSADGHGGAFTGTKNTAETGEMVFPNGVAAGNLLATNKVVPALVDGYLSAEGPLPERLMAGLKAAQTAGSDSRGLLSAALLVLDPDRAPLSLRIDHSDDPLAALSDLHRRATSGEYAFWAAQVPSLNHPERGLD